MGLDEILETELEAVNIEDAFAESIRECYAESACICT